MQIPIVNGIYSDNDGDFRQSYPVNMIPVPLQQGISTGYLRPADGLRYIADGPGIDRGGINWRDELYRVMGSKLVHINKNGIATVLADVGSGGQVTFDYSFDYLAVAAGGNLFYWDGTTLQQVTDPDLGTVVDMLWVDGYFMTTDGEFLIVTELNDPFSVNPLRYGSSEADPDPIKGLFKIRNEVYALNRYTIEVFDNVGGDAFPFQRIEGAQIQKGVYGTNAACVFIDTMAFMGSGRNESPAVYLASNGIANKISTREVDLILEEYDDAQLEAVVMESRIDKGTEHLLMHLPDRTLVYDRVASQQLQEQVWFVLTSGLNGFVKYKSMNMVWCYKQWNIADPTSTKIGVLDDAISTHWGQDVRWEFATPIVYNESRRAIFHEMELVALPGRVALGDDPYVSTSYSLDGVSWSQEKYHKIGKLGNRMKRIAWLQQGGMTNYRIQRFRGDSQAHISFARLEARVEGLA